MLLKHGEQRGANEKKTEDSFLVGSSEIVGSQSLALEAKRVSQIP